MEREGTVTAVKKSDFCKKQRTCNELIPVKTTAVLRGHRSNRITPPKCSEGAKCSYNIGMYFRMSCTSKPQEIDFFK